jgi:hypothetical protein
MLTDTYTRKYEAIVQHIVLPLGHCNNYSWLNFWGICFHSKNCYQLLIKVWIPDSGSKPSPVPWCWGCWRGWLWHSYGYGTQNRILEVQRWQWWGPPLTRTSRHRSGDNVGKLFSSSLTTRPNKLECLYLAITFQSSLTFAGSIRSLSKK